MACLLAPRMGRCFTSMTEAPNLWYLVMNSRVKSYKSDEHKLANRTWHYLLMVSNPLPCFCEAGARNKQRWLTEDEILGGNDPAGTWTSGTKRRTI